MKKLLKTKATKLDPNNIRKAGVLDEHGQRSLKQLNEMIGMTDEAIDKEIVRLSNAAQNGNEMQAGNAPINISNKITLLEKTIYSPHNKIRLLVIA